jgi:hypothetical protein
MARMIPPLITDDAPPGERQVFHRLASDPETDGWTVLHSLDIAEHVRQVQGEADFVVVAPGHGVAVIEVKSHGRVARQADGQWLFGSMPPTARGPFQQASEAMHSIRNYLVGRQVDLRTTPVVSGVWFTNVRARASLPQSPEWHAWQLLDRDDFRTGAAQAVLRLLKQGTDHLVRHSAGFRSAGTGPLDLQAAAAIVAALRPRFELAAGSADLRRDRQAQLSAFLDEQYDALDAMQGNQSALFTGPAGSGKTFLALEAARREAGAGRSGWLLCFNRALGDYLQAHSSAAPGIGSGTLHAVMLAVAGMEPPPQADRAFWQGTLVDATIDALLDRDQARDYLIVDEVQDLTSPEYLDILDLLVKGGLAGGRCLLFGDFERQALYGLEDGRESLSARIPTLATCALTANCRNLPRIGTAIQALSGMSPGYKRFRRQDDGIQPRYYWYTDPQEQGQLLARAIRQLRDDGYALDEVAVLSPRREGSAAAASKHAWLRQVLVESALPRKGRVRYCTIHSFKGLESPAVVLTDIDRPDQLGFEALLYVGLSRPTDRLSVIGSREALGAKLLGGV